MRFFASASRFLTSDNFQEIHTSVEPEAMAAACNSTICQLSANVLGRTNFGGGLLKLQSLEVRDLRIPDPTLLDEQARRLTKHAGLLDLDDPERHALDGMVFDILGLTTGERDEEGGIRAHIPTLAVIDAAYLSAKTGEAESPDRFLVERD